MTSTDVLDIIRRRRSVRRYTPDPVSDEQIKRILLAAMNAPSAMNRRPWHFLVIRDEEVRRRLAGTLRLHPYVEQAPALIAVLAEADTPAWRLDLGAAVQNMLLQATAEGLGSVWIGAPGETLQVEAGHVLQAALGVPADLHLFAFVAIGHPAENPPPHEHDPYFTSVRVHYDIWQGLDFEATQPGQGVGKA